MEIILINQPNYTDCTMLLDFKTMHTVVVDCQAESRVATHVLYEYCKAN